MAYFVENIERITEQMIEEEVLNETEAIRVDSNTKVQNIKQDAIDTVWDIEDEAIETILQTLYNFNQYKDTEQSKLIINLGDKGIIGQLNKILDEAKGYYDLTVPIAQDTTDLIETDIRQMIVDKGYHFEAINDGYGNITLQLTKDGV